MELNEGSSYEVVTRYKEIPVRLRLKLKWIEKDLIGFDGENYPLIKVFSSEEPVYIKLDEDAYLKTSLFSNLRHELILRVEGKSETPPFMKREMVRVEPDPSKPVYANICIDEVCSYRLQVANISERGVCVLVHHRDEDIIKRLEEVVEEHGKKEHNVDVEIEFPNGEKAKGKGIIRSITEKEDDIYVKIGLMLSGYPEEIRKISNYVLNRQREILASLKMFL